MTFVSQLEGALLLGGFAVFMISAAWLLTRQRKETLTGFLVADREVGLIRGALSSAATFIWVPAVFVCSLQAFKNGVPGIFWFMFPNILCFIIFAQVAKKVRTIHPNGFTLTELIHDRMQNKAAHIALLTTFILWLLTAVAINGVAGGAMLSMLSGLDFHVALFGLSGTALVYSLISGMRASIITDALQMVMVMGIAFVLVPWVLAESGGIAKLDFGGLANLTNPLDPTITYEVGILAAIGLIGGTLQDQMFYQRAYSVKPQHIRKMFYLGGAFFALVPLALSVLGFIGADLVKAGSLEIANPEMVGPAVIGFYLPKWALGLFVLMAFAGLASTLDSAFCAISSIVSVDIYQKYINTNTDEKSALRSARIGMIAIGTLGVLIASLKPDIFWIFLTYGAVAVGGLAPVLYIIYGKKPNPKAVVLGVVAAFLISIPTAIYGNVMNNVHITIWGTVLGLFVSTVSCFIGTKFVTNFEENPKSSI